MILYIVTLKTINQAAQIEILLYIAMKLFRMPSPRITALNRVWKNTLGRCRLAPNSAPHGSRAAIFNPADQGEDCRSSRQWPQFM